MPHVSRLGKSISILLGLWPMLVPNHVMALSSDKNEPMYIEADRAELDDRKGMSTYTGGVQVTQGTLRLTADRVTVHNKKRRVVKVVAVGKPAEFKQRPDNQENDVRARAERIEYYGERNQLVLLGNAKVWQAGNIFQSDRITYNMKDNVVNAGGEKSEVTDEQRVRITIQPDSSSTDTSPDTR